MLPRVPFAGFLLFFIAGIVTGDFLFPSFLTQSNYFLVALTALIFVIAAVSFLFFHWKKMLLNGVFISVFFFCLGIFCFCLHGCQLDSDLVLLSKNQIDFYEAEVLSLPEKRPKSLRFEASIRRIKVKNEWQNTDVKLILSLPQDVSSIPEPKDILIVKGSPERAKPPMNPEEFDYQRYLRNKGVVWTDYLPDDSFCILKSTAHTGGLRSWSISISGWADEKFRENLKDNGSYGLVKAMLLGRRDDLRTDQIDDYTTSGTVHILSVSGMHVAVIFMVMGFLLGWIKKLRGGKYIYLLTITSFLSFYALVTGLPPSVQRATLMCIVFVVAEVFGRKSSSINTLAISAFLILLIDPQALFDVGFQLSYLAMLGIFLLYKPIDSIYSPTGFILKYIWQITALSFAAQLATFPLSLYYFHQFPFYFWLVNPFVITLTNALLPAAILLLFVCLFPLHVLQMVVGTIVHLLSWLTNISAAVPKILPGYLIENLYLDKIEIFLLYGLIFTLWYACESRKSSWLRYSFLVGSLFVFYSCSLSIQTYISSTGVIHGIPKHSVLSFKEGNKLFIYADSSFVSDTNAYKFHIKNYAIREGATETVFINLLNYNICNNLIIKRLDSGMLFFWKGNTLYSGQYFATSAKIDYHMISDKKYPKTKRIRAYPATTFILGGTMGRKTRERWIKLITDGHFPIHDVLKEQAILLP